MKMVITKTACITLYLSPISPDKTKNSGKLPQNKYTNGSLPLHPHQTAAAPSPERLLGDHSHYGPPDMKIGWLSRVAPKSFD